MCSLASLSSSFRNQSCPALKDFSPTRDTAQPPVTALWSGSKLCLMNEALRGVYSVQLYWHVIGLFNLIRKKIIYVKQFLWRWNSLVHRLGWWSYFLKSTWVTSHQCLLHSPNAFFWFFFRFFWSRLLPDGHLVHTATSQGLSATCCGRFWHKETHLSEKSGWTSWRPQGENSSLCFNLETKRLSLLPLVLNASRGSHGF